MLGGLQVGGERRARRIQAAAAEERGPPRQRRRKLGAEAPQRAARLRHSLGVEPGRARVRRLRAEVGAEDLDAQPAPRMCTLAALELLHQVQRDAPRARRLALDETVAFEAFEAADVPGDEVRGRSARAARARPSALRGVELGS